ncbi:MAG: alpha/beta fold hydrolase [Alphaproteobacteria bacterium]|nr:alpha/beta fold hydrolase [Alphaproteobacteria bacterium]
MPDKVPLLFLPGLLCDAALWQNQINALKNMADCHVADLTQHDRMAALAQAVLAKAPPRFALAALSMGGYVAFEILRQAPERVLKLCLLDTSARPDTEEQKKRRRMLMSMAKKGEFKGVTPRLLPTLIHADRLEDKALTDVIMDMAARVGREAFLRQQDAIIHRIDSRPFLKDISCPTQVIGGRQDALTPPEIVQEIADGIPGAKLNFIENCGHLSALERPEEIVELMKRWLKA